MRNIEFTVAKLAPALWDKIKSGEKKFEIRTEEFKGTHVVFVEPGHPDNVLGVVRVTESVPVTLHPNHEFVRNVLCELAKIDSKRFNTLFNDKGTVFLYGVTPVLMSGKYLKLIEDALNVFSLYHERQRDGSMPWTQFLEKYGKVKED